MTALEIRTSVAVLCALVTASANAQSPEILNACTQVYSNAVTRVSTTNHLVVGLEALQRYACSTAARASSASFDARAKALIEGVPALGSLLATNNVSSQKAFCERYSRDRFDLAAVSAALTEPVVDAMLAANDCIELATSADVLITHVVQSPRQVIFSGRFTRADRRLLFTSATEGGFECKSPREGGTDVVGSEYLERKGDFSVICSRAGDSDGGDTAFPAGSVALVTTEGVYTVKVPSDSLFGVNSRREAARMLAERDAQLSELNSKWLKLNSKWLKLTQQLRARTLRVHRYYYGTGGDGPVGRQRNADTYRRLGRLGWRESSLCGAGQNAYLFEHEEHRTAARNYISLVCESGLQIPE